MRTCRDASLVDLSEEMGRACFGDARLSKRLETIVSSVSAKPSAGFPMAFGDEAASEAFYRFLRNDRVSEQLILKPHVAATVERCKQHRSVLVLHDTTQFQFGGDAERDGVGLISNIGHGFFGHIALAVDEDSAHPLGVLGLTTISRMHKKFSRGTRAEYLRRLRHDPTKESLRWGDLVEKVEMLLEKSVPAIHVMDRESDSYVLIARMLAADAHFVIRVTAKRRLFPVGLDEPLANVYEHWEGLPDLVQREVPLSARKKSSPYYCAGRHPLRGTRIATLRFSAKSIRVKRASNVPAKWPAWFQLNAVRVYEVDAPEGEEPIEWLLLTTETISTTSDVARIVDIYRARWTIEEFFKALKTGCAFERRQLASYATLKNALAILAPIAWKILVLRSLERNPDAACVSDVVNEDQVEVLREMSPRRVPEKPSVAAVIAAIAAIGGHLRSNGPPGWQVLWRGYQELLTLERAWRAARRRHRCDQS